MRLVAIVAISLSLLRTAHKLSEGTSGQGEPLSLRGDIVYNLIEALGRIHHPACCPYCCNPEVKILESTPSQDTNKCEECLDKWVESYDVVLVRQLRDIPFPSVFFKRGYTYDTRRNLC